MDEAEKKNENDIPVNLVNMENVDNTKHSGLFDEAFVSPNEEVQVRFVKSGKVVFNCSKVLFWGAWWL